MKMSKAFRCPSCFILLPDADQLIEHLRRHDANPTPYKRSGSVSVVPKQEVDSDINKRQDMLCEICGKSFLTEHEKLIHMGKFHPNQLALLEEKVKLEETQIRLRRHDAGPSNTRAGSVVVKEEANLHPDPVDLKNNRCGICGKSFFTEHGKQIHVGRSHPDQLPNYELIDKKVKLEETRGSIQLKLRKCKVILFRCDATSSSHKPPTSLEKISLKQRRYKCPYCWRAFPFRNQLRYHCYTHTGERPFECPTCSRAFNQPGALKAHQRMHTGELPHKCEICPRRFSCSGNLTKHIRIHTGERPYKCDKCGKSYRDIGNLKLHMRRHKGKKELRK